MAGQGEQGRNRRLAGWATLLASMLVLALAGPAWAAGVESCADVRAQDPTATDGIYTIAPGGHVFTVHCVDMDADPQEYLVLPAGPSRNFGFVNTTFEPSRTEYSEVRINPLTLQISTTDTRFGLGSGAGLVPLGTAGSSFESDTQHASIDLSGTPFEIDDSWVPEGDVSAYSVDYSLDGQSADVSATAGFSTGSTHTAINGTLQLRYGPSSPDGIYRSVVASDHPVGYWPLDETSGGVVHDRIGGHDGTLGTSVLAGRGPATQGGASTRYPGADGAGGRARIPTFAGLRGGTDRSISVEAWLKPTDIGRSDQSGPLETVLGNESPSGPGFSIRIRENGSIWFLIGGNGFEQARVVSAPDVVKNGRWLHYVGTYDGTTARLWINGAPVANDDGSPPFSPETAQVTSTGPLLLGGSAVSPEPFRGGIDDVAVYDHALSPDDVARHYDAGLGGVTVPVSDTTLSVSPAQAPAGAESVPVGDLSTDQIVAGDPTTLAAAPLRSTPLRSTPLRSTPLRSTPLRSTPLRSTPLAAVPLRSTPLRSTGWADVLRGTPLADAPLTAITLDDVFKLNAAAVDALTLDDIDLASSPLRSTSLGALMLGDMTARQAGLPDGGLCPVLAPNDANCDSGALAGRSLTELELAGYDLTPYFRLGLPLPTTGLADTPLGGIALGDVRLAATPLGDVPASVFDGVVSCAVACGGTLAELQAATPSALAHVTLGSALARLAQAGRPEPSLAALLVGIVPADELPLGLVPLNDLLRRAPLRAADLVTTSVSFTLDCTQAAGLRVAVPVPDGLRFAPGSAHTDAGTDVADPANTGGTLVFDSLRDGRALGALCDDETSPHPSVRLTFAVEPPAATGTLLLRANVSVGSGESDADSTTLDVTDGHDAGATPATAQPIQAQNARTGYIASPSDLDTYALDAPAPGSRVTVTLSHLPADYDVSVLGPPTGLDAVRASPLRSTPLRSTPLLDQGDEPGADPRTLAPQTLQDAPLRSTVLDSTPLRSTSMNRNRADESSTFVVESTDAGSRFYVQVAGHNGATSPAPYVLDVKVVAPVDPPQCVGRRTLPGVPAGSLPSQPLDPATQTLFLVDEQRTIGLFGQTAYDTLRTHLDAVAAMSHGAVLEVDGDPAVRAAYDALDANRCSEGAANHVAEAINHVVDQQRAGLTGLRHIVLVGGDDLIPQVRVRDLVSVSNERQEADDLVLGNRDSAISRALRDGYVLTDDPYGDFDPQSWLSGQLFVPDVALGRLVETPDEISGQLDQFETSGGVLKPQEARVAGYDFLADGATEVLDQLKPAVGDRAVSEINDTWNASTAIDTIRRASAAFTSINAHYDQHRALPASAFNATGAPDLVLAGDATPAPGSVLFTMGCHAGLSLPDSGVLDHAPTAADTADPSLLDWAQQFARSRSVFVGNTGYGYGDTTSVAWSERIMSLLAGQLAGGKVTAGQALMFAKQRFIADSGVPGVYDAKASEEATFYGLPMYRIGDAGGQGASVVPTEPSGGTTVRSDPFSVDPSFVRKDSTDRGSHWEVDGEAPQVSHFRPIQPRTSLDVTASDGLPAHGALVEDLRSSDLGDIDAEYARPTIDLSANEPEVAARSDVFPASIQRVSSLGTPDGIKDRLVLIAGQFITDPGAADGRGTQRLFGHIAGEVLRSSSADYEPPALRNISGELSDGGATFTVETPDADATRGVVLYRDDTAGTASTWRRADLTQSASGVFTATGAVAPGATKVVEYTVQLADAAGNVSVASNKGPGYTALAAPPPSDAAATIDVSPAEPAGGFFRSAPTVSLGAVDPSGYQYRVDAGDFQPYTGPFSLLGDGTRIVTVRAPDGTIARRTVRVDGSAPLLADAPDPAWSSGDTTAELSASDPVGGSGVASLTYHATGAQAIAETTAPGDHVSVPVTAEGVTEITYGATDRAGNESAPRTVRVRIDRTDPTAHADIAPAPHGGWNRDDATVHVTGEDDGTGAGVEALLVSATGAQRFDQRELPGAAGDVTITTAGVTTLSYRARDAAGRLSPPQDIVVRIDRAAPSAAHAFAPATPASGWFAGPADVALSATDPDGGSGVDALHYSATGAQPIDATDAAGDHATVHVTHEGITHLTTTATDTAGNRSAPDTATVRIDTTGPSAHHAIAPAPNAAGWNRTAPTVTLSAADDAGAADASGVDSIAYRLTGPGGDHTATAAGDTASVPVTAEGVTTVAYTAHDRAGNPSGEGSAVVRYDATAPVTTAASLSPAANAAGWNAGPVTATLGGRDDGSRVGQVVYAATGAQPISRTVADGATAAPQITREGITTLTWTVRDAAGNESAPRSLVVRIDATKPEITCTPTPAYLWPQDAELDPVKVAVAVKDGGSGPAGFTLQSVTSNSWLLLNVLGFRTGTADTSGWLRAIGTLFTRETRTYTLTYEAVDVAGNTATCDAVVTVAKPPRR